MTDLPGEEKEKKNARRTSRQVFRWPMVHLLIELQARTAAPSATPSLGAHNLPTRFSILYSETFRRARPLSRGALSSHPGP